MRLKRCRLAGLALGALVGLDVGASAIAGGPRWEFAGWYGGGCYPNVEHDPVTPGRVYLTSDVAGIWRSDDGGKRWRHISRGLSNVIVAQVAIARPSGVLYAATAGGLFNSSDNGENWRKMDDLAGRIAFERPASYRAVLTGSAPGSVCVGTSRGEVLCLDQSGKKWRDMKFPKRDHAKTAISALQWLADGAGMLAAAPDGVFRYDAATRAWTRVVRAVEESSDLIPLAAGFAAAVDGDLWTSDAGGAGWRKSAGKLGEKIYRIEHDRAGSRVLAGWNRDWSSGIAFSTDLGASWQATKGEMTADIAANPTRSWASAATRITSLKLDPFNSGTLWRADWWGVWRSADGGASWSERIVGAPNTVGSDLAIAPTGELLSATMDNGIMLSQDGGRSFRASFPGVRYRADLNGHVWRIGIAHNGRIVATSSPWNTPINQVLISDDGGRHFRPARRGLPTGRPKQGTVWHEGYPRGLAFDPFDKSRVYLAIDGDDGGGLYVSRDGGESWARSTGQPASLRIYNALAADRVRANTIYWGAVGAGGGIYRSVDAGATWAVSLKGGQAIFDIHTAADGAVYATGDDGSATLHVSRDHGETWRLLRRFDSGLSAKAIASSPVDPRILAVGTINWSSGPGARVYLSRDAGERFVDLTQDLPVSAGIAAFAFSPDGRHLYASQHGGGIYKLQLDPVPHGEGGQVSTGAPR